MLGDAPVSSSGAAFQPLGLGGTSVSSSAAALQMLELGGDTVSPFADAFQTLPIPDLALPFLPCISAITAIPMFVGLYIQYARPNCSLA